MTPREMVIERLKKLRDKMKLGVTYTVDGWADEETRSTIGERWIKPLEASTEYAGVTEDYLRAANKLWKKVNE